MRFTLKSHVDANGDYSPEQRTWQIHSPLVITTGQWVHLECRYRWSLQPDGLATCWQNGQQILDAGNIITDYDYLDFPRAHQWTVNNYANLTIPSTQTIYVDDAAISNTRRGTGPQQ